MNKVTTVNLNGIAYQLEESGYEALRAYLDHAASKLAGNPDRDEIISDIEQAIADKLRALLGPNKNVVTTKQVQAVIADMGPVDGGGEPGEAEPAGIPSGRTTAAGPSEPGPESTADREGGGAAKRLYRLYPEGAMLSGVCNGLGAYFNIDPTIIRVAFVVLAFVTVGGAALAYVVMVLVVPLARTAEQKNAARGAASTAQEFIRRAKEGYYEGMKSFPDRAARRAWKRKFRQDMRQWRHSFQSGVQAGAQQCQQNWQQAMASYPAFGAGWGIALPFLSLIHAGLALACILAMISLLGSGSVFGVLLPVGVPVWAGILILLFGYKLVVLPLKLARHAFKCQVGYGVQSGPAGFVFLWDAFVWLAFAVLLVWLGIHHLPEVTDALRTIPAVFHDAIDAVQRWWSQR